MARKTNYAFERNNRAKLKADKREAKRQAKLAKKAEEAGADEFGEESAPAQESEAAEPATKAP